MYEPCTCERCDPKPTYVSRFVGWLDSRVLKRFLVYNYTPENIVAQNEVQELLENDGAEDGGAKSEHIAADLNQILANAIAQRQSDLAAKRTTAGPSLASKFKVSIMQASTDAPTHHQSAPGPALKK